MIVVLFVKLAIEVAIGCHCQAWAATPNGWRCTAPLDHPLRAGRRLAPDRVRDPYLLARLRRVVRLKLDAVHQRASG